METRAGDEDECRLSEKLDSITVARAMAARMLSAGGYQGNRGDVLLVVTELVTNALVHGRGAPSVRISADPSRVRIEVSDDSPELPRPREPGPADGWGLHVIERLGAKWGVTPRDTGKVVWCEMATQSVSVPFPDPDPTG